MAPRYGLTARASPPTGPRVMPPCAHPRLTQVRVSWVSDHPCLTRRGGQNASRLGVVGAMPDVLDSPRWRWIRPLRLTSQVRHCGSPCGLQAGSIDLEAYSKAAALILRFEVSLARLTLPSREYKEPFIVAACAACQEIILTRIPLAAFAIFHSSTFLDAAATAHPLAGST